MSSEMSSYMDRVIVIFMDDVNDGTRLKYRLRVNGNVFLCENKTESDVDKNRVDINGCLRVSHCNITQGRRIDLTGSPDVISISCLVSSQDLQGA